MITLNITQRPHIGPNFPDDELDDIYQSLLLSLLPKVIRNDALHRRFCRLTNMRGVHISVQVDMLYMFAECNDLLGIDTDGLL